MSRTEVQYEFARRAPELRRSPVSHACPAKRLSFVLFPHFSLVGYSSAVEALRLANEAAGFPHYAWETVSEDGKGVSSACRLNVAVDRAILGERALLSSGKPSAIVLCGGNGAVAANPDLLALVRAAKSRGTSIVSLGSATSTLANAGMLRGRKCAVHWEMKPGFMERHSDIEVTNTLFEIDAPFITSAGGGSSFELMLQIIKQDLGQAIADRVCEKSLFARSRERLPERLQMQRRFGIRHPVVRRIVKEMEEQLEEPRPLSELASSVGLSCRQVERIFVRELGRTPIDFYREIRLEHANSFSPTVRCRLSKWRRPPASSTSHTSPEPTMPSLGNGPARPVREAGLAWRGNERGRPLHGTWGLPKPEKKGGCKHSGSREQGWCGGVSSAIDRTCPRPGGVASEETSLVTCGRAGCV